jgi:hypothetical protein
MEGNMSFPENKLTVRSQGDLVTAVPYLIGFHPGDGSVVVLARSGSRIIFATREDLPTPGAPAREIINRAEHLVPIVRRQQPITDLMIIGYGEPGQVDPTLRTYDQAFTASGITVRELLRVTGSRIFNLTCDKPACCPPQGTPFDPTTSLIAVEATAAGQVALPNRAALAARIAPATGAAQEGMRRTTSEAATRLKALATAGSTAVYEAGAQALHDALRQHASGKRLTDSDIAWLTLLLTRTAVRDLAIDLTEPHEQHVTLWVDVTRRADQLLVPAPATLLALTAWRCGNGPLALMAAERALQVDPAYQLAGLLLQALQAGMPPSVFEEALAEDESRPGQRPVPASPSRLPNNDDPGPERP